MDNNICTFISKEFVYNPSDKAKYYTSKQKIMYRQEDRIIHNEDLFFGSYLLIDASTVTYIDKMEYTKDELIGMDAEFSLVCNYLGLYYHLNNDKNSLIRIIDSDNRMLIYSNGYCRVYKMGRKILKLLVEFYVNIDGCKDSKFYNI